MALTKDLSQALYSQASTRGGLEKEVVQKVIQDFLFERNVLDADQDKGARDSIAPAIGSIFENLRRGMPVIESVGDEAIAALNDSHVQLVEEAVRQLLAEGTDAVRRRCLLQLIEAGVSLVVEKPIAAKPEVVEDGESYKAQYDAGKLMGQNGVPAADRTAFVAARLKKLFPEGDESGRVFIEIRESKNMTFRDGSGKPLVAVVSIHGVEYEMPIYADLFDKPDETILAASFTG